MTAMTPKQFETVLDVVLGQAAIARHRAQILEAYKWAYGAAHERTSVETVGGNPGPADPTAAIVGDSRPAAGERLVGQAAMRRTLERAPKRLVEIDNELRGVERALTSTLEKLRGAPAQFDPLRYPISVTREDLEAAREAQQRRMAAGEGIP